MRILDLQRRLREVGRIRIGEKGMSRSGKEIPVKLSTFRLTSRDRQVIEAAADVFGGTAGEWTGAPDGKQWQVTTEADAIPVIVPPGDMSFSQAYEQWSAGGCKVRCDGQWDHVGDKGCHCDPDTRACDIHTRLSVIVPDLPGLGVWRLDTQGYYAAVELGGIADVCAQAAASGRMLPARLRLEQRSVKRIDNGKIVTRNFPVPVLDVDVHPLALTGGVDPATGELAGGLPALPAGPSFTPVPPQIDGSGPSLAEQMASIDEARPPAPRRNAAAPVPATGLKPRTARQAADEAPADREEPPAGPEPVDAGDFAERVPQRQRGRALVAARELAEVLGVDQPTSFEGITDPQLQTAVLVQLGLDPGPDDDGADSAPVPAEPEVDDEPEGGTVSPMGDRAPAAVSVSDVARFATSVFRPAYDAAPRGDKTKVVERLRHALVWAITDGATCSLKDLEPAVLFTVHRWLRSIANGEVTYDHDTDGVTFALASGSTSRHVAFADLEASTAA